MKIIQRGPADTDLSQRIQNDKLANSVRNDAKPKADHSGAPAKVDISKEARELQRISELARTGDELRAQKVKDIKEQLAKNDYNPNAQDVAKSIARSEVSRVFESK